MLPVKKPYLYIFVLYILETTARWCPMSPHFLIRLISRLLGLVPVSWATAHVGVHRLSLFAVHMDHISIFFNSLFFTYHWISFVFLLYNRFTCGGLISSVIYSLFR